MNIRPARPADATPINALIMRNLREVNATDYPRHVVQRLLEGMSPKVIAGRISRWQVLVAEDERGVAGAAGLDGNRLRMFFVAPERHYRGIGTALLDRIMGVADHAGYQELEVFSSLTAETYYAKRGFARIEELVDRGQTTVLMKRAISPIGANVREKLSSSMKRRDVAPFKQTLPNSSGLGLVHKKP